MKLIKEDLSNIGFEQIGEWNITNAGGIDYSINKHKEGFLRINNALYAFALDNEVMYIGKTTKSIKKRFVGYVKPGNSQATNAKCHKAILKLLKADKKIEIWSFAPIIPFQILGFEVNLAAGLEDDLINKFKPKWNNRRASDDISDLVEFSEENTPDNEVQIEANPFASPVCNFKILLAETYYKFGYINPGVTASQYLDIDGAQVKVFLGNSANFVYSTINRRANVNGSVRIIGNNSDIAKWFQANFEQGNEVSADVINKQTVFLRAPTPQ
jgi:hypothetical protein